MTIEEILARKYADARGYHAEDIKDAYQAGIEKAEKDYVAILKKECPPCYNTEKENRSLKEERRKLADELENVNAECDALCDASVGHFPSCSISRKKAIIAKLRG